MALGAKAGHIWDQVLKPLYELAPGTIVSHSGLLLLCGLGAGFLAERIWSERKAKKRLGMTIAEAAEKLWKNAESIAKLEPIGAENEKLIAQTLQMREEIANLKAYVNALERRNTDKETNPVQAKELERLKSKVDAYEDAFKKSVTAHYEKDSKTLVLGKNEDSSKLEV